MNKIKKMNEEIETIETETEEDIKEESIIPENLPDNFPLPKPKALCKQIVF
jgi:hypothetical protein